MKIENYAFGSMTVGGEAYRNDLIVFPEKVRPEWWRKSGHSLAVEDLKEVIDYKPEVLVVGKGAYGAMNVPEPTRGALKKHNIALIDKNTDEACKVFNGLAGKGKKTVGAFHLTC